MRKIKICYTLGFNTIYLPTFSNLKDTMSFLHFLFTLGQEHHKVFHKVPIIGLRMESKEWQV